MVGDHQPSAREILDGNRRRAQVPSPYVYGPDPAGPEADLLARKVPDLDLFHPWELGAEEAVGIAKRCEAAAFAVSKKIRNSEGASDSRQHSQFVFANSLGFMGGYASSRHWISCAMKDRESARTLAPARSFW